MEYGFFYVPKNCEQKPSLCKLHVHYHGCMYKVYKTREFWANVINLNEYAESNDIVIFHPQTAGSKASSVGCWNWEAYNDDKLFDTREGMQLKTVMTIVEDLDESVGGSTKRLRGEGPPKSDTPVLLQN